VLLEFTTRLLQGLTSISKGEHKSPTSLSKGWHWWQPTIQQSHSLALMSTPTSMETLRHDNNYAHTSPVKIVHHQCFYLSPFDINDKAYLPLGLLSLTEISLGMLPLSALSFGFLPSTCLWSFFVFLSLWLLSLPVHLINLFPFEKGYHYDAILMAWMPMLSLWSSLSSLLLESYLYSYLSVWKNIWVIFLPIFLLLFLSLWILCKMSCRTIVGLLVHASFWIFFPLVIPCVINWHI